MFVGQVQTNKWPADCGLTGSGRLQAASCELAGRPNGAAALRGGSTMRRSLAGLLTWPLIGRRSAETDDERRPLPISGPGARPLLHESCRSAEMDYK